MGIKGWFTVFGDSAVKIREQDFKGKCIGIDVSYDIYRASLGMRNMHGLTDSKGTPTLLLNTLLCNIVKYKKLGIKGLVYVFDNPAPNPHKLQENQKRKQARKKAELRMLDCTDSGSQRQQIEKRTFTITDAMINDVKKLLTLFGVAWIVSPSGFEAEHLGAELTKDGIIDSFITSDSDTLLFGGLSMIRRVKKAGQKKCTYEEYILDDVLTDYELTHEQFVHIGVILGSDFANGTKGIGVKTVLKKGLTTELTSEQKKAKDYFLSKCPYAKTDINKESINKEELINWLVTTKLFDKKRITAMLKIF